MVTADEIREFARANGLEIYPGQDPENWIKSVLGEGGICPCAGEPCPCNQAVDNIRSARDVDNQHCGCYLFVSPKLHAHVLATESGPVTLAPEVIEESVAGQTTEPIQEVGEEAARIAEIYARAEQLIAEGRFDEAKELLMTGKESTACGLCAQSLALEERRTELVKMACESGDEELCELDRTHAIKSLQRMQVTYKEVARENGVDVPEQPAEAKKPRGEYRACMSTMIGSSDQLKPLVEVFNVADQHKAELAISAKLCSGKATTPEEAVQMVIDAHPNWVKPEV